MSAPTRPQYLRNTLQWDFEILTDLVESGQAKAFSTPKGTHYVVKTAEGSFGVRPDQVVNVPDPLAHISAPQDLSALRARIEENEHDHFKVKADAEGISVDELTDGEYTVNDEGHVVSALEAVRKVEDDLLAKFIA